MNASNIFKILVRSLMVIFIIAFVKNIAFSSPIKENYKEKASKLQIENTDTAMTTWFSLDQKLAKAHLKEGMKYFSQSNEGQFMNEIKTAKFLIADDKQSSLYLEIEKAEKAYENVFILKKNLEAFPALTQKFVRLISNNNPMVVGHIVEEKADLVSIRDQDGFIIPIHKKNIQSMKDIDGAEKDKIYKELLAKVMEDNGKTSSYGLYLSAKWAHENDLKDKVNSILIEAAMSDSQILMTIADNEARKILSIAKWSNLLGDYEVAKEKAQVVITSYAMTSHLKDAEDTMQDILKNMEKEKKILATLTDKKPADNAVAAVEPEKFVEAPVLKPASEPEVKEPEVVAPVKNTLKIKNKTEEAVNQKAIQKPTDNTEEIIEDKNAGKNDINNPPIKNALHQDKTYQEASDLVKEGKELMKKANSYDNPGNKNAQLNYQKALNIFKTAVHKLNKISKKFAGNEEFEELAQQASGMEFFITKSCLRIKY